MTEDGVPNRLLGIAATTIDMTSRVVAKTDEPATATATATAIAVAKAPLGILLLALTGVRAIGHARKTQTILAEMVQDRDARVPSGVEGHCHHKRLPSP